MPADRLLCDAVTIALAAGEPADAAHLATCATCRARGRLMGALGAPGAVSDGERGPTAAGLRAAVRVRALRRGAAVVTALVLVALATFGVSVRGPEAPPVDLLAALDDADRALAPVDTLGEDLLALVDPLADDPDDPLDPRSDDPSDPLLDALLGEGSL